MEQLIAGGFVGGQGVGVGEQPGAHLAGVGQPDMRLHEVEVLDGLQENVVVATVSVTFAG